MKAKISFILTFSLFAVSTSSIIARFLPDISAVVIAFWRMAIAASLIWIYSFITTRPVFNKKEFKYYILSGFFLALHFTSFYGAVKHTSIANATLLGITAPMFTIIYEKVFLKRTIRPLVFIGFVLAGTGILIITGSDFFLPDSPLLGKLFGLTAALCIAFVYIFANKLRQSSKTIGYTKLLYGFAAIFLLFFSLISSENVLAVSVIDLKWLVALGIIPTILGHSLLYYSIKFTSPTVVASVPIGEPIIASFLAWIILKEGIGLYTLFGGVLILFGVYFLVAYSPSKKKD